MTRASGADAEFIRRALAYDPATGIFRWRPRPRVKRGAVAGAISDAGYLIISLNRRNYRAHRLAWLLTYGHWPDEEIDHINGARDDNRIVNLRAASHTQNLRNTKRRADNTAGLKGVSFHRRAGRFRAQIQVQGRTIYLGLYDTAAAAHSAYVEAAREHFGEFARTA